MMNEEQFLEKLSNHKGEFHLDGRNSLRTTEHYFTGVSDRPLCPIERVLKGDTDYIVPAYMGEATSQFENGLSNYIIYGADFSKHSLILHKEALAMREKMLSVLGLEEPNET